VSLLGSTTVRTVGSVSAAMLTSWFSRKRCVVALTDTGANP
jgi:hypothetical protein